MLRIEIPNNNVIEREYIINTLLTDFLGLNYQLELVNEAQDYTIKFDNSVLVINDAFFNRYNSELSYLCPEAIPSDVKFTENKFLIEKDIPVIYGNTNMHVETNKIVCGIDIFASAYYMLSRWEEHIVKERDDHNRFAHAYSLAVKHNFLKRPVVNEYVELLWNFLIALGYEGERKARKFRTYFSFDIDRLFPGTFRIVAADILKRKNIRLAFKHFSDYLSTGLNPFDTFDFIMNNCERVQEKARFYFMSSNSNLSHDTPHYLDKSKFKRIVRRVKKRGHVIGFHPGYSTYKDINRFKAEKELLNRSVDGDVVEGRQHYLRFSVPETYRVWNESSMKMDSSMGYASKVGFRCGTGDMFRVFDFINRKPLALIERPLIVMDGTLKQHYSVEEANKVVQYYVGKCKKYHSALTILFHNDVFYLNEWKGYRELFSNLVDSSTQE